MTVLLTRWVVALNGALGVAVAVGGFSVLVGGDERERVVLVKKGVNVGRGVLLGVAAFKGGTGCPGGLEPDGCRGHTSERAAKSAGGGYCKRIQGL